ncbi:TPA: ferredoxin [Candidatus Latescibacteria bacterium]|nr:ferredoxin [Candidatus Latescibacterota bacterium]
MPTFTLNGQEVEITPGRNVLQTADDRGVHIPHYCYHKGLSAPANCRMCLVEIEMGGRRGLMPSCTAMPAEGMIVDTETDAVKHNQEAIMEFLLVNHPLDCPVCDQAGECELQNYSFSHGPDASRFMEEKSVQPKKDIGKNVMLYSDRCIRCTRCIRFCDEISGTSELGYFNRGIHNEIDVFPGIKMDNRLSGNTVDICPVGALLDKEFLFKQRVWFLQEADSVCPGCSTGCNVRADINKERIYRLMPRENLEVNDYWMCDDGRHGWGYVHSDDRILFPTIGRGESENLVLWEAAFAKVQEGISAVREANGECAAAAFASPHLTNEEQYLFAKLVTDGLSGAQVSLRSNVHSEGDVAFKSGFTIRADKSPNARGVNEILGALGVTLSEETAIWDGIRSGAIKALLFFGGDPLDKFSDQEKEALLGLDFLVVLDILSSDVSQAADVVLPGAAFIEKDGTYTNYAGRVQQIAAGLEPPGDARAEWQILTDLSNAFGATMTFTSAGEVMREVAREVQSFSDVNMEGVGGVGLEIAVAEA